MVDHAVIMSHIRIRNSKEIEIFNEYGTKLVLPADQDVYEHIRDRADGKTEVVDDFGITVMVF